MEIKKKEGMTWNAKYKLEKYHGDFPTEESRKSAIGVPLVPYEVIEGEGNLLLDEGVDELFTLIGSSGGTKYDNTNARIGVGNSNAAAVKTQTGLQGGSTVFKGMDATFPTVGASQKIIFKATFASGDGNFAWEEWTVDNGATADLNLNRKVVALGTKVSGTTWVFTVEVSLS